MFAYFEKDTSFIGFTDKDEKFPMIIRAGALTKIEVIEDKEMKKMRAHTCAF